MDLLKERLLVTCNAHNNIIIERITDKSGKLYAYEFICEGKEMDRALRRKTPKADTTTYNIGVDKVTQGISHW